MSSVEDPHSRVWLLRPGRRVGVLNWIGRKDTPVTMRPQNYFRRKGDILTHLQVGKIVQDFCVWAWAWSRSVQEKASA